ncbi:MAG: hypothetical protein CMK07_11270 [Ponticaulis sp.]|nr:hypothetical protein [Ponticaulis sp.]
MQAKGFKTRFFELCQITSNKPKKMVAKETNEIIEKPPILECVVLGNSETKYLRKIAKLKNLSQIFAPVDRSINKKSTIEMNTPTSARSGGVVRRGSMTNALVLINVMLLRHRYLAADLLAAICSKLG